MPERHDFARSHRHFTFVDLFAGAGGISEGFLQADCNNACFDLLLASDINANCELTHRVRYNCQLGLTAQFLTDDIMSDDFLPRLLDMLHGAQVDVVTGGPSCQSFSLAGRRRRFDKRDDLFRHYLKVIRALRPKYFVMENVKGLLTKDKGRVKELILSEMRSLVDAEALEPLRGLLNALPNVAPLRRRAIDTRLRIEQTDDGQQQEAYLDALLGDIDQAFQRLTRALGYKTSKSDAQVATLRHGLQLLAQRARRRELRAKLIELKTAANIDNDDYVADFTAALGLVDDEALTERMVAALDNLAQERHGNLTNEAADLIALLRDILNVVAAPVEVALNEVEKLAAAAGQGEEAATLIDAARLYRIEQPWLLNSADYGVPQLRERVVFVANRRDQAPVEAIRPTVEADKRVCIYEALHDLDFLPSGQAADDYHDVPDDPERTALLQHRQVDGQPDDAQPTYAEWQRRGRLTHRFENIQTPFYVRNLDDIDSPLAHLERPLHNHEASRQNDTVRRRLELIAALGDYDAPQTKQRLAQEGLDTDKRDYVVLQPEGQAPTVATMPDDFIHYSAHRPLTVREMARLQSFDDDFVFQGKRQTGGENRKREIPQFTLVGNAVPPLMARAIANALLEALTKV